MCRINWYFWCFLLSFKDLNLSLHYDSEEFDLVKDFYIPVLSESTEYFRAVGFFNSKSLSLIAPGLKEFILNKGSMKLVCGADLSPEDVKAIVYAKKSPEEVLSNTFLNDLNNIENYVQKNHIQVLGWMIANNMLDIKIAIKLDENGNPQTRDEGILHYKIGILKDSQGNFISFSGSNNETFSAWSKNIESFDVFKSWEDGECSHLFKHIDLFNRTFNGEDDSFIVMDVPLAVKKKLIDISPKNFDDLKFEDERNLKNIGDNKISLFDYQISAINSWFDSGKKGIFSMATGTGKTYTSLGCLDKLLDEEDKLITLISVPYQHLIRQWEKSIEKFGISNKIDEMIIVDATNPKGKDQLMDSIIKIDLGYLDKILVLITHKSLCSDKIVNFFNNERIDSNILLIGDEMHGLGSYNRLKGLSPRFNFRLGLSATPERVYDDVGTNALFAYFGDVVFSFSLEKALNEFNPMTDLTYLTPFRYVPYFVELNYSELKEYSDISRKLNICGEDVEDQKKREKWLFQRANILKNANNKYNALRLILSEMNDISNLLIYCSEKQIDKVLDIVGNEFMIPVHTFTNKHSSKPKKEFGFKSERDIILEDFSNGYYKCLVSMHCLDEGVDVPSASKAILMCNSSNPREFIQRVGRVIRRNNKKHCAEIYDMIVKPANIVEFSNMERSILAKEKLRAEEIAKLARNSADYFIEINNI